MACLAVRFVLLAALLAPVLASPPALAETGEPAIPASLTTPAATSAFAVDYGPIAVFNEAFGREEGGRLKIAYAATGRQGMDFLEDYVGYLAAVPVSGLSRNDQLAYWLNTRNVLVVEAMSDSRSRRRMAQARGTAAEPGDMWTEKRVTVDGHPLSIDDIERGILLANWADTPNIVFGLYQGTRGGASLPPAGFDGATVREDLARLGRDFVNSRDGVRVRRGTAEIPEFLVWHEDALFGGDRTALVAHLATLADADTASGLAAATDIRTRSFSYRSDELILREQGVAPSAGGGAVGGGGGSFGS